MRIFTAAAAGLATVLMMSAVPASAQPAPPGAQEACTPDVMRLCQQLVSEGNHGRIKSCLIRNRRALSPECARFFAGGSRHHHRHRRSR